MRRFNEDMSGLGVADTGADYCQRAGGRHARVFWGEDMQEAFLKVEVQELRARLLAATVPPPGAARGPASESEAEEGEETNTIAPTQCRTASSVGMHSRHGRRSHYTGSARTAFTAW